MNDLPPSTQFPVIHEKPPSLARSARNESRFRIRLTLPGKDIKGTWLCRALRYAMAYQSYCCPGPDSWSRIFKPYMHDDGKTYLQDQEGNWLSYESIWQCLYMASWHNAVAWKIEGNRLVRDQDGAVLTLVDREWPLADGYFLAAEPLSSLALQVEKVEVGIAVTLINNCAFEMKVSLCGVDAQLPPRSSKECAIRTQSGATMTIEIASGGKKFSQSISTGNNFATEREFDYPISDVANIYQHIESSDGVEVTAMKLNFGPAFSTKNWMSFLDLSGDPTFAEITIPGTHDTATWDASRASRCQALPLESQLERGVRWLDLRLAVDGNDLRIWHGLEKLNVFLGRDILPVVKSYLLEHDTETIIISVVNVSWKSDYDQFDSLLHELLIKGVTHNKLYDRPGMPKVKGMGGCVLLMRQDKGATFGVMALDWPDDSTGVVPNPSGGFSYSVQNCYKFGTDYLTAKWDLIKAQLERARTKSDGAAWYVNYTSASRAPITDPVDIALASDQQGMNYQLHEYLCGQVGPQYFGLLPMDFPGTPIGLTKLLVSMNKLK
jgi:hypothetical protein